MILQPTGELIELHEHILDELAKKASEEAYIEDCEIVGPNSNEFDDLVEDISAKLYEKYRQKHIDALQDMIEAS